MNTNFCIFYILLSLPFSGNMLILGLKTNHKSYLSDREDTSQKIEIKKFKTNNQ